MTKLESTIVHHFIEQNKGLIFKIATKRFGPMFAKDEIISEAFIACDTAIKKKRKKFLKPGSENVLWWYLQKHFDELQEFPILEEKNTGFRHATDDANGIDFDRLRIEDSDAFLMTMTLPIAEAMATANTPQSKLNFTSVSNPSRATRSPISWSIP